MQQKKSNPSGHAFTIAEANEAMFNKWPKIKEITIPREVLDMYDLRPHDKLLYGLIYSRPNHKCQISFFSISGILAIGPDAIKRSIKRLVQKGLLEKKTMNFVSTVRRAPNLYVAKVPPRRFIGKTEPSYTKSNIDNLEENINDYFDEIKV